jgi:hypothetical protein
MVRGFFAASGGVVELHGGHLCRRVVRHVADVDRVLAILLSRVEQVLHHPRHLVQGSDQRRGDPLEFGRHCRAFAG